MKLFWTEPAIQDLQDLRDYIANDSDIHRIIYRVTEQRVEVLAVIHGNRNLLDEQTKPWDNE